MQLVYKISIPEPHNHHVKIRLRGTRQKTTDNLVFFLPVWSPGSYLVREYARHIRGMRASDGSGQRLFVRQLDKCRFEIVFNHPEFRARDLDFVIDYEVYCNELTVRTAHVDSSHAFLHGPALYLGVEGHDMPNPQVELDFVPLWSHVSTTLEDISDQREKFVYRARDYDDLLDRPIEIGCHETDGFMAGGKEHWWVYWGKLPPLPWNLKEDIKKIVETVAALTGEMPYEKYMFIAHFAPGLYGGLEHSDSTVLAYDPFKMVERKSYLDWLALVAHEYFHVWNVKRIRPKALGPFDYTQENYTRLLWLAEGLTVFMDELLVYRAGLSTLNEYLEQQKANINRLLGTPGRRFHSLEESSFNAWVKLYRPDENSVNSTVSYYLKGGLTFFVLNAWLVNQGKSIDDFIQGLWLDYKQRPEVGIEEDQVFALIEKIAGKKVRDDFAYLVSSTDELPLEQALQSIGLEAVYEINEKAWCGMDLRYEGERVFIDRVLLDGAAHRAGLNAGDEIISVAGLRTVKSQWERYKEWLMPGTVYEVVVARKGQLLSLNLMPTKAPALLKEIKIVDQSQAQKAFN